MENEVDFKDLSRCSFNDSEYEALRQEQNLRLEMVHNHGFTLVSIILVFFSAIFLFVAEIFKLALKPESVIGRSILVDSFIVIAIVIFCAFPVLLIYCFSAKYEDNLRQIVSVAMYQRVFYEFPTLLKRTEKTHSGILAWELFHCNSSVPKAKLITAEYVLISFASIILSFFIGIALFSCAYITNKHYYNENNIVGSIVIICIFFLFFIAFLIGIIFVALKTRKNTQTGKIMNQYSEIYFKEYISLAEEKSFLSNKECDQLTQLVEEMQRRDEKLNDELKFKKCKSKKQKDKQ